MSDLIFENDFYIIELKACPVCEMYTFRYILGEHPDRYQVVCDCCGMRGPMGETEIEAKDAWNKMPRFNND